MAEGRITPYNEDTFVRAFKGYFNYKIDKSKYENIKIYYRISKPDCLICLYTDDKGGFYRKTIKSVEMRRLKMITGKFYHMYNISKPQMNTKDVRLVNFYLEHAYSDEFTNLTKNITILVLYELFADYEFIDVDAMALKGEFDMSTYMHNIIYQNQYKMEYLAEEYKKNKSFKDLKSKVSELSKTCDLVLWSNGFNCKYAVIKIMLTEYAIKLNLNILKELKNKKEINSYLSNIWAIGPGSSTYKKTKQDFENRK